MPKHIDSISNTEKYLLIHFACFSSVLILLDLADEAPESNSSGFMTFLRNDFLAHFSQDMLSSMGNILTTLKLPFMGALMTGIAAVIDHPKIKQLAETSLSQPWHFFENTTNKTSSQTMKTMKRLLIIMVSIGGIGMAAYFLNKFIHSFIHSKIQQQNKQSCNSP